MSRKPPASDVQHPHSNFDAGNAEDLASAGAAPGADAALSPAQMRALRRSARLTSDECVAHRRRADQAKPKPAAPRPPVRDHERVPPGSALS